MPKDYAETRISLLYRKGNPRDAANCRAMVVSTCMYQSLQKSSFAVSTNPSREGCRHTNPLGTLLQGVKVWSLALQTTTPDVVLLDIVKAYPSTPQPLLWAVMHRVEVPSR